MPLSGELCNAQRCWRGSPQFAARLRFLAGIFRLAEEQIRVFSSTQRLGAQIAVISRCAMQFRRSTRPQIGRDYPIDTNHTELTSTRRHLRVNPSQEALIELSSSADIESAQPASSGLSQSRGKHTSARRDSGGKSSSSGDVTRCKRPGR